MGAEAAIPLRAGDVLADTYEVESVLGVGGMGAVFAAVDMRSGARVAVKCLLPEYCEHADVVTRFHREARATFRLQSPHVIRCFETGTAELLTGDPPGRAIQVPFIVMELLEGRDLRSLVKNQGPIAFKDAARYVRHACLALAEAHALGIVHRDLKPANLFLTHRPNGASIVKVLDFGIAKFLSPNIAGDYLEMTKTRAVLGSRAYMAPEQMLRPKDVDVRADVWALGIILYFLVTGRNPFAADTTEAMILQVIQGAPHPLGVARPDAPEGFEAVVLRCLAKSRDDRFPNVSELSRALAPFAKQRVERTTVELSDSLDEADLIEDDEGGSSTILPAAPPQPSSPTMRGYSVSSVSNSVSGSTTSSSSMDVSEPEPRKVSYFSSAPTQVVQPKRRGAQALYAAGVVAALLVAGTVVFLKKPAGPSLASGVQASDVHPATTVAALRAEIAPQAPVADVPAIAPAPASAQPTATASVAAQPPAPAASVAAPPKKPIAEPPKPAPIARPTAKPAKRKTDADTPW